MPKQVNVPSRRERIAEVTREDLSVAARALLTEGGGPDAVTVRAVAARAGMTAPAIYRYFTNREALLGRVMSDILAELAAHIDEAGTDRSLSGRERLIRICRALRLWAVDHRIEFGLLFGTPQHRVEAAAPGCDGLDFEQFWLRMFAEVARDCAPRPWPADLGPAEQEWVRTFREKVDARADPALAMRFLYAWQEVYGSICTEIFGHLHWALDDAGPLFEARLDRVADDLGLDAPGTEPSDGAPGMPIRPRRPS